MIWLGLASLLFLIFAWENIQTTILGYRVEQIRQEIRSLKITNEYLHYRLESALSPARLHFVAQKRLGMVAPDLSKIVVLAPSAFGEGLPVTNKFADAGLPGRLPAGLPSAFGEGRKEVPVPDKSADTGLRAGLLRTLHASIAFHKLSNKSTPNN